VSIAGFEIPLGAWLVSCVLLVLAHFATRSSAARASTAVGGRLCSPTLAQLWAASVV